MAGSRFDRIPTVLRSQEILNKSFSKVAKIMEPDARSFEAKVKKEVIDKISTMEAIITSYFRKLVKKFPSTDELHPFYRDLLDLMFDVDKYKISLSKLQRTSENISNIATATIKEVKKGKTVFEFNRLLKSYYGRVSSLVKDLKNDLIFLSECRDNMKQVPSIDPNLPTFIIAGAPNVGKSSLMQSLTGSDVKVATYPFTTQSIYIGYLHRDGIRIQVIDTPGILDRPFSKRNVIERKAILALKDIDSVIIFIFDASQESYYSYDSQEKLFNEIQSALGKKMIRIQSKADISEQVEDVFISAKKKTGLKKLLSIMMKQVGNDSHENR